MRGDYLKLLEETILLENINVILNDDRLLKTIGLEIIHNAKLYPYLKNGIPDMTTVNKKDFESENIQNAIVILKPKTKVELTQKIYTYMIRIANGYMDELLKNHEIMKKIEEVKPQNQEDLQDTIRKMIYLLIVVNDAVKSKASRNFMVRPSQSADQKILDMDSAEYSDGLLSQTV